MSRALPLLVLAVLLLLLTITTKSSDAHSVIVQPIGYPTAVIVPAVWTNGGALPVPMGPSFLPMCFIVNRETEACLIGFDHGSICDAITGSCRCYRYIVPSTNTRCINVPYDNTTTSISATLELTHQQGVTAASNGIAQLYKAYQSRSPNINYFTFVNKTCEVMAASSFNPNPPGTCKIQIYIPLYQVKRSTTRISTTASNVGVAVVDGFFAICLCLFMVSMR